VIQRSSDGKATDFETDDMGVGCSNPTYARACFFLSKQSPKFRNPNVSVY